MLDYGKQYLLFLLSIDNCKLFNFLGLTVTDCQDCGKEGSGMALVQMSTTEEAIKAIAKFHNVTPPGHHTKNNAGLCFSFSGRKSAGGERNREPRIDDHRQKSIEKEAEAENEIAG